MARKTLNMHIAIKPTSYLKSSSNFGLDHFNTLFLNYIFENGGWRLGLSGAVIYLSAPSLFLLSENPDVYSKK